MLNRNYLHRDGILPVKGYDSVNLPSGLYKRVKALVESRAELGYRSIAEFVTEAVRKRMEEVEALLHAQRQFEEKSQVQGRAKEKGPQVK